jgi:predicted GNAT family acetyltransferase
MEIRKTKYSEVEKTFVDIKSDLLDENATYYGAFIKEELIGIVSYVENPTTIYLCHAFVKEEYRNSGIYKLLWEYRNSKIKDSSKQIYAHCNVDSLKHFINNGYRIDKALFKVIKT